MAMPKPFRSVKSRKSIQHRLLAALLVSLLSVPAMAQTLSFSALPNPVVVGSTLQLGVNIAGITDLFAYQFSVGFNPAVFQATGVTEGSFLSGAGGTTFIAGTVNNTTGVVSLVASALSGSGPGASGAGSLATISFNTIAVGVSTMSFAPAADIDFINSAFNSISLSTPSLVVNALPIPEPGSLALMGLGLGVLLTVARRKATAAA